MKKFKNIFKANSLRGQIVLGFIGILMFLLILMEIFQYYNMKNYLCSIKEQILDARFHNIDTNSIKQLKTTQDLYNNKDNIINMVIDENSTVVIIDKNGNYITGKSQGINAKDHTNDVLKENDNRVTLNKLEIIKLSKQEYDTLLKTRGTLEGYKLIKDSSSKLQIVGFRKIGNQNNPVGLVQFSIDGNQVKEILDNQMEIYIFTSILILLIGGIVSSKVFKHTLKPLYKMKNTVEKIDVNKLDTYLPEKNGQVEIDSLAIAFNNMLTRIELSFKEEQLVKEKMRQFVSDASHELRTPLTSIHGFVEVLLRGAAKNEEQLDLALNSILIESERLAKLVNDLLLLTKLDHNNTNEKKKENIASIVEEVLPQIKILLGERQIELEINKCVKLEANKNQIKQVIYNLVQNAIRHTDEKLGKIIISVVQVKGFVVLSISDNGTGISEENINKIFDRFFRSEKHRARKYGGYGLGLSIVKSIVDAHNGKIEVKSEEGKGSTFYVFLPMKEE